MVAFGLATLCVLVATLATLTLPALHPAQLWTVSWAFALSLFAFHLLPYPPMRIVTAALAFAALVAFVLGTFAGDRLSIRLPVRDGEWSEMDRRILRRAAVWVTGAAALLFVAFTAQVAQAYGLKAVFVSSGVVRTAIGQGFASVTIKYLYLAIATAALAGLLAAIAQRRAERRRWQLVALLAAASAYFSTGRGTIVLVAIVAVVAYFGVKRLRASRFLAVGAGAVLFATVALVAGGALIGKTYQNAPIRSLPSYFTEHPRVSQLALPYEYFSAAFADLQVEVDRTSTWGRRHGCGTLSTFCKLLHAVGVPVQGESALRPFTPPPLPWNTYTGLDMPLIDGGFGSFLPIVFLLGMYSGYTWRRARLGYMSYICIYGMVASAIVFSIAQNNFFAPHIVGAMVAVLCAIEGSKAWEVSRRPYLMAVQRP